MCGPISWNRNNDILMMRMWDSDPHASVTLLVFVTSLFQKVVDIKSLIKGEKCCENETKFACSDIDFLLTYVLKPCKCKTLIVLIRSNLWFRCWNCEQIWNLVLRKPNMRGSKMGMIPWTTRTGQYMGILHPLNQINWILTSNPATKSPIPNGRLP